MKNEIKQYSKGDIRRLFVVAAAIDELGSPTLLQLSAFTMHNKGTIQKDIDKLREQLGVVIEKKGPHYNLVCWGEKLKKKGVIKDLRG